MKKRLFFLAAAFAGIFSFVSCDGIDLFDDDDNPLEGLLGSATIVVNKDGVNDTVKYKSSIVDAFSKIDSLENEKKATVGLCANVNLSESNASLQFPFMYFRLEDTVTGNYQFDTVLSADLLLNLNFEAMSNILADPYGGNMVVLAESDTAWYLSHAGSLTISKYPSVGHFVECTFNNVEAFYITQSGIDRFNTDLNNMDFSHANDLGYYFKNATISGNTSSRRTTIVSRLIKTAFEDGGLTK